MKQSITLYGFAPSTFTRSACMAAHERGLKYELAPAKLGDPAYLALHPFGKMPVLKLGDRVVFETLAIVAELDALGSGPKLIPEDLTERTHALCWASALSDYLYSTVVGDWCLGLMQDQLKGEALETTRKSVEAQLDAVDAALAAQPSFCKALSVADLLLAPMLAYVEQVSPELISQRKNLARAYAAYKQRPSFSATAG